MKVSLLNLTVIIIGWGSVSTYVCGKTLYITSLITAIGQFKGTIIHSHWERGFLHVEVGHQGQLLRSRHVLTNRIHGPSRALVVPSLCLGYYSPGPVGTLNCIDPLLSVSNYYLNSLILICLLFRYFTYFVGR